MNTIDQVHNKNRPMPEMFQRQDIRNSGGWDVGNVRAVRGEPYITVSGRIMRVPLDDSNLAKAIRAHEQVHVKVSPQNWSLYINDVTPEDALRSAEEARVNFIASKLGFPMKSLVTGSEKFDGKQLADCGDWPQAVYAVAASVHTGSLNPLIAGIRTQAPEWATILRDVANEIVSFQKKQIKNIKKLIFAGANKTPDNVALSWYGSTASQNDGSIVGMNYTIELAMLLDSIASLPAPPMKATAADKDEEQDFDNTEADDSKTNESDETSFPRADKLKDSDPEELKEKAETIDRKAIQKQASKLLRSSVGNRPVGEWLPVKIGHIPLTMTVPGAIGRKRVASNMGRNPRRMHRMLTDPDRRIFDKFVKSNGGVVVIDVSGSMKLSKEEVRAMMEAAPGCTVIGYATSWHGDNTYILADKGRVCSELPEFRGGNGCDLPVIEYALSRRTNRKSPVIWVTDGMVYRPMGSSIYDEKECARFAQKNNIHMEYSPEEAIDFLKSLQCGQAYKPQVLPRWKEHLNKQA